MSPMEEQLGAGVCDDIFLGVSAPSARRAKEQRVNTLTSMLGFYRTFGSIPVDRLPGTIEGPFKSTRYYLED